MTNFIEATKIELKKRTPEELVDKITELVTDKIVKDKEIERLNKIIEEIDRIANTNYQTNIYTGSYSFKRGYNEGSKFFQEFLRNKLKKLKEKGDKQ